MSESKNPPTPIPPSVIESATGLLGALSDLAPSQLRSLGPTVSKHLQALRAALARIDVRGYEPHVRAAEAWLDLAYSQPPEPARSTAPLYSRSNMIVAFVTGLASQLPSRPFTTETEALALEGITLMKRNAPPGELTAAHVTAVIDLAAAAFEIARGQSIRWEADMRAIKRWQAGEPDRDVHNLVAAVVKLAGDMTALIAESEGVAGPHRNGDIAPWSELLAGGRFEEWLGSLEALREAAAAMPRYLRRDDGQRQMIWPDHADLTVWLIWLLERRPEVPGLDALETMASRLGRAGLWHASQGSAHGDSVDGGEVAAMLRAISAAAIAADRRAFVAEVTAGGEKRAWSCAARRGGGSEEKGCDWPVCGCDPFASEVIDNLVERGVAERATVHEISPLDVDHRRDPPRLELVKACPVCTEPLPASGKCPCGYAGEKGATGDAEA